MKLIHTLLAVALFACILPTASCKKTVEKELEREKGQLTGTWTVQELRYVQTDTLGNSLRDSVVEDAGTIEFAQATDVGSDVFHPVIFRGACASSELVAYFRGHAAGDPVTGGGWVLYWDADPAAERLVLWGIAPSSSFHRVLNFDGNGDRRTMWYMLPGGGNTGRQFFYFQMEK